MAERRQKIQSVTMTQGVCVPGLSDLENGVDETGTDVLGASMRNIRNHQAPDHPRTKPDPWGCQQLLLGPDTPTDVKRCRLSWF